MKHIVILSATFFLALTTQGQDILHYLKTYSRNETPYVEESRDMGVFKNPSQLLKNNKIVTEVIYYFESSRRDSIKKEEIIFYNDGYEKIRVNYLDEYTDSLTYTYNRIGISEIINKETVSRSQRLRTFYFTTFGYDTLTGNYSEYRHNYSNKAREYPDRIIGHRFDVDSTYRISSNIVNERKNGYILSWQQIFKFNRNGGLTEMKETQLNLAGYVRTYTFTIDKNNKYIKGESVSSSLFSNYKEKFVFDNQNRIVKITRIKDEKQVKIREFLYNVDGTIYKEITTNGESVQVKKHYYTKL